jgi:hypothetical protein
MRNFFLALNLWMVVILVGKSSAGKFHDEADSLVDLKAKRLDKFRYFGTLGKRRTPGFSKHLIDKYRYFGTLGKRDLEDFVYETFSIKFVTFRIKS